MNIQREIFRRSSKTFYYSTLFFPKNIQADICKLYAYVRTADDFVDSIPQEHESFFAFRQKSLYYIDAIGESADDIIIAGFIEVYRKYNFERIWLISFLDAMQSDLGKVYIKNQDELEQYMYGSAAVVGYMMCAIFGIRDADNLYAAKMLAYSMQYINFIRDVDEDTSLGRKYLFNHACGYDNIIHDDQNIAAFIEVHIKNYFIYLSQAQKGLHALPATFKVAVLTASDAYNWTARTIQKNPSIIFYKKIKPQKSRLIYWGLRNVVRVGMSKFAQRLRGG